MSPQLLPRTRIRGATSNIPKCLLSRAWMVLAKCEGAFLPFYGVGMVLIATILAWNVPATHTTNSIGKRVVLH